MKILIPTDFSENASDALKYALHFIGQRKATLHILHVVDNTTPSPAPEVPAMSTEMLSMKISAAKDMMKALEITSKEYLSQQNHNIEISTKVVAGMVIDSMLDYIEESHINMVIMGTEGENHGQLDKFFGTITTRFVNMSTVPVIFVPRGSSFTNLDELLFATKIEHSDPFELDRALKLIAQSDTKLRCLHISKSGYDKDDEELKEFSEYLLNHASCSQSIFYVEEGEDIENMIKIYADTYNSDLIIISKSKRSFLERFFKRSHAEGMINISTRPLFVLD